MVTSVPDPASPRTGQAPGHTEPAAPECAVIESVMSFLGRAWAGAVIEAMLGGASRFSEISRSVGGVSDAVLTARLRELCDRGLVERRVEAGPPTLVTYVLTEAGRDLAPVISALTAYGLSHPEVLRDGELSPSTATS